MRNWLSALFTLLALALPASAQNLASLVADRVTVSGQSVLVADGNVEVAYRGRILRATRILYDQTTDRLSIEGPITLNDGAGNFVLASQAELSADLADGVLTSARLVLNRQLQIAATNIVRAQGRYTQLTNTVASSCQVCRLNPTPLWEIRADRVIHDQLERQLYFERATLRAAGVPIFYLPQLRLPDPTLARARGFLTPSIRTTSGLGTGLKLPYFLPIGDSRDLTITPYISTKNGRTVELLYRQATRTGQFDVYGSVSRDRLIPGETRGYLLSNGAFALPRDFTLTFKLEQVSDRAYLLDYGITDRDRLDSRIEVSRTRRNQYVSGRFIRFQSIRAGESNESLPSLIGDLTWHQRFSPQILGGEGGFKFQLHSGDRTSTSLVDANADGIPDGRDLRRTSVTADWRRNWVLPSGILASALGEVTANLYSIDQDPVFQGTTTRIDGGAAIELRWPLVAVGKRGVSHVIEPIAQLVYTESSNASLPNEDSALVEFDEGNLFSLNRFSGADAYEQGGRLNLGVNYTRFDPAGWQLSATAGRVFRVSDDRQFGPSSGLAGKSSDWLTAVQLQLAGGLIMTNRLVFDDRLTLTKAEVRAGLDTERYGLSSSYILLRADAGEYRPRDTEEMVFDARYAINETWTGKALGRYDFTADRASRAGLGLQFRNECLSVDLSLSRRFTSSTSVTATTDFGFSVDLLGFGSGTPPGPARTCRR